MIIPDLIEINIQCKHYSELQDIIIQMVIFSGTKNHYTICFPKTDSFGNSKLYKSDIIGQFEDHYESGIMDYNGTIESASSVVAISLFDDTFFKNNKPLVLAWPLLHNEKRTWQSRKDYYDYLVMNRNSYFNGQVLNVDLHSPNTESNFVINFTVNHVD